MDSNIEPQEWSIETPQLVGFSEAKNLMDKTEAMRMILRIKKDGFDASEQSEYWTLMENHVIASETEAISERFGMSMVGIRQDEFFDADTLESLSVVTEVDKEIIAIYFYKVKSATGELLHIKAQDWKVCVGATWYDLSHYYLFEEGEESWTKAMDGKAIHVKVS